MAEVKRHLSFEDLSATLTDTLGKMRSISQAQADEAAAPKSQQQQQTRDAGPSAANAHGMQDISVKMGEIAR